MTRPRLLDLFCGAGGCSVGYQRAGFDVVGVDIEPHPDYPFEFIQDDALEVLGDTAFMSQFDAAHASPPCQAYTELLPSLWNKREGHQELIAPVRDLLDAWGGPYVIENVPGAKAHLRDPVMLCGSMFGLGIPGYQLRRHRFFEVKPHLPMLLPQCSHRGAVVGVYGDHLRSRGHWRKGADFPGQDKVALARQALGIDWMGWSDLSQSIPPAFTEFIGEHLAAHLAEAAA
jgi:DNA (cytosine-5)-methyltransferase 1